MSESCATTRPPAERPTQFADFPPYDDGDAELWKSELRLKLFDQSINIEASVGSVVRLGRFTYDGRYNGNFNAMHMWTLIQNTFDRYGTEAYGEVLFWYVRTVAAFTREVWRENVESNWSREDWEDDYEEDEYTADRVVESVGRGAIAAVAMERHSDPLVTHHALYSSKVAVENMEKFVWPE